MWCHAALQVILTEDFDRGLMVLRRLMRWEMIDVTYTKMMETKKGAIRWDNEPLVDVPTFESLPQWVSYGFCELGTVRYVAVGKVATFLYRY